MDLTTKQIQLLILPLALIISTISIGYFSAQHLSMSSAFLVCFLFYWIVWCYAIPIIILGKDKILALYSDRLPSPKWLAIIFILMPFVGTIGQIFISEIAKLTISILAVTMVAAIINGIGEELLWRGTFTSEFPKNKWLGIIYPAFCYGLWHFAPLSVSGFHEGWPLIIFGPMILGLFWGWIAQKSGSILWISIAHILVNFFALIGRMFLI